MKILMFNWRDLKNPKAGGAEVLTEGIFKKLAAEHEITLFTASFPGSASEETVNGYRIIRKGSAYTVHFWAMIYWFRRFRKENYDVVIDQIHGIPFFTPIYIHKVKVIAFIHEVAREIWLQMYPFPIGRLGYMLEPIFFWFYKRTKFITVSNSTKQDLIAVGIPEKNISITQEAIDDEMFVPVNYAKEVDPTLICLGRLAPMKRPEHVIEAFRIAHAQIPNLKLWMVGGGDEDYVKQLQIQAGSLPVSFFGKVGMEKKKELLSKAWVLVSASMKEGFGLVVIEAAAMKTPSIVYDVHGFRDSVKDTITGILSKSNPEEFAKSLGQVVNDENMYIKLQSNSESYSRNFNFTNSAEQFHELVEAK